MAVPNDVVSGQLITAEDINAMLAELRKAPAIYTGTITGQTLASGALATATVAFPAGLYGVPPRAFAQLTTFVSGATNVIARHCDLITKDGCRVSVVNAGADTTFADLPFQVVVFPA